MYYESLLDISFKKINNLTCFCYRQYFWMDFRLSNSPNSAIHSIIQSIFWETDLLPSYEVTLENIDAEEESKEVIDMLDEGFIYPIAKKVVSEFIAPEIIPIDLEKMKSEDKRKKIINFDIEHMRNKRLGDQGEKIVYFKEIEYLKEQGLGELANKVKWISKEDDKAGYDILSYELDGTEKLIEVKSTNAKPKRAYFHMSSNQYEKAKTFDNYYIYVVFEAKTETPKIWRIRNPFQYKNDGLVIVPSNYRVLINIK